MLQVSNCPWQICSCLRTYPLFQYFQFLKSRNPNVLLLVFSEIKNTRLHLKFLPKHRQNYKNIACISWTTGSHCTADSIRVAQPIRLQHLHKNTSRILLIVYMRRRKQLYTVQGVYIEWSLRPFEQCVYFCEQRAL